MEEPVEEILSKGTGYLVSAPGRSLAWQEGRAGPTRIFEIQEPSRLSDAGAAGNRDGSRQRGALNPDPPEMSELTPMVPLKLGEGVPAPEAAEAPVGGDTVRRPQGGVFDEDFVNWITRRVDEGKVEVPFRLPVPRSTEPSIQVPDERVRVRYRIEP